MDLEFERVIAAYTEPHRAYHNVEHLDDCLRRFDEARQLADRPDEIEASLWFHDVIYDTHGSDNEIKSAVWALDALTELGIDHETSRYVAELVLATRHDAAPFDTNAALLLDIDLSVLGRSPADFDTYERQIRQEYSWVPEPEFRSGRSRILESFLARPRIYETAFFFKRLEEQARINLTRSVEQLRACD